MPQKSAGNILDIQLRIEPILGKGSLLTNTTNYRKCDFNGIMYLVFSIEPHLMAYDICSTKWHKISLWSHKYTDVQTELPVRPRNIVFDEYAQFLVTDVDGLLYIHRDIILKDSNRLSLDVLGTLLGPTDQLLITDNDTMFYVIEKFGAIVRCNLNNQTMNTNVTNVTTEDNEIMQLTNENIQQIFSGPNNTVWLLPDHWLHIN